MDPEALEQLLRGLEHNTVRERTRAQLELTKLKPRELVPHAARIIDRLEH